MRQLPMTLLRMTQPGMSMKLKTTIGLACVILCWSVSTNANSAECNSLEVQTSDQTLVIEPLPQREGPRVQTSGRVPHVQLDIKPEQQLINEVSRLAFLLPGVEERPTIVSLPGAKGMWLENTVPVVHSKAIVSGREFSHIHEDGSLHAPLPYERALEVEKKGWGELHPWADRFDGWEGLVMLYSPTDTEQLKVLIQLVTESYNYVTGQTVSTPGC